MLCKDSSPPEEELRAFELKENEQKIYGTNKAASIVWFFLESEWLNSDVKLFVQITRHM